MTLFSLVIVAIAVLVGLLLAYLTYWLIVDARERKAAEQRADARVRAVQQGRIPADPTRTTNRYLNDDDRRPE